MHTRYFQVLNRIPRSSSVGRKTCPVSFLPVESEVVYMTPSVCHNWRCCRKLWYKIQLDLRSSSFNCSLCSQSKCFICVKHSRQGNQTSNKKNKHKFDNITGQKDIFLSYMTTCVIQKLCPFRAAPYSDKIHKNTHMCNRTFDNVSFASEILVYMWIYASSQKADSQTDHVGKSI